MFFFNHSFDIMRLSQASPRYYKEVLLRTSNLTTLSGLIALNLFVCHNIFISSSMNRLSRTYTITSSNNVSHRQATRNAYKPVPRNSFNETSLWIIYGHKSDHSIIFIIFILKYASVRVLLNITLCDTPAHFRDMMALQRKSSIKYCVI